MTTTHLKVRPEWADVPIATGPQEVIVALANGQFPELVLGPDRGETGSPCSGCRSLFPITEATCPYCPAPCAKTSLWREVLSHAAQHGVAVHFVPPEARLDVLGRAAALLVCDEPPWAPATSTAGASSGREA